MWWCSKTCVNFVLGVRPDSADASTICLAYKGNMEKGSVYGSYRRKSDQVVVTGEINFDLNLQSDTWTHTCIDLRSKLIKAVTDRKGEIFDMENVMAWNVDGEQIWIDEVRLGKVKQTITVDQTQMPLTFNGKMPSSVDLSWSWDRGTGLQMKLTWPIKQFDDLDWTPSLPEILVGDDNTELSGTGFTDSGSDWRRASLIDQNALLPTLEAALFGGEPLAPYLCLKRKWVRFFVGKIQIKLRLKSNGVL